MTPWTNRIPTAAAFPVDSVGSLLRVPRLCLMLALGLATAACDTAPVTTTPSPAPSSTSTTMVSTTSAAPTTTSTAAVADLTGDLAWFAPLPPMPTDAGRPFTGSDDFMDLFAPGAPWTATIGNLQVFKLYGEWVAYHATPDQLRTAITAIRDAGLALAVEAGPLDPPAGCGQGIEGFAGTDEGKLIAERVIAAGGRIDAIALDEPFYFGSIYDGPGACHWDATVVAAEIDEYVDLMRTYFPDVVVGDTEPTPFPTDAETYVGWLETFRAVTGHDLAFLHLDIDWSRGDWTAMAHEVVEFGGDFGVPIGIIYTGNAADTSDERWLAAAGERVKAYEALAGAQPPQVLFQSWMDHPDVVLPESSTWTFTNMVLTYFEDRASLGFTPGMLAGNLALGGVVTSSNSAPGAEPERAVDGDAGTNWSAGGFAPQWVEVTLDGPSTVTELRLIPSQFPAGVTTHRVLGRIGGTWTILAEPTGETSDGVPIVITAPAPWTDVTAIRIETTSSPSWVAWYEIEVVGG